jgi:hypothetical protein
MQRECSLLEALQRIRDYTGFGYAAEDVAHLQLFAGEAIKENPSE